MTKVMIISVDDDLPINHDGPIEESEAQKFIDEFKSRFITQGYYFTANMERIPIDDLEFVIIPEEEFYR